MLVSELMNIRAGDFVNVKAYVSEGTFNWKKIKGVDKKFFECDLTDASGTVFGSFFEKSRISNKNYYEFECLRVRVTETTFELQETVDTTYRLNESLSFKTNFKLISP